MTHDELLARIDAAIDKRKRIYGTIGTRSPEIPRVLTDYHNTGISFLLALRAVVELIQKKQKFLENTGNDIPMTNQQLGAREERTKLLAEIIQAIEKELE